MDGLLFKGVVLGFSVAAPVGPIGLLCIRRSLTQGRLHGLVTGLGAATADALYGCVAGFGLTAVSTLFLGHKALLQDAGGLFLGYLGIKIALSEARGAPIPNPSSAWQSYFSSLLLTVTNPMTILSFMAIFAGLGIGAAGGTHDQIEGSTWLVAGVFLGSAAWWLLLSSTIHRLGRSLGPSALLWINRASGIAILAFACVAFLGGLRR